MNIIRDKFLLGGLRNGDLKLLILTMALSILCVSAVGLLIGSIKSGLENESNILLGGDKAIISLQLVGKDAETLNDPKKARLIMSHWLKQGQYYLNLMLFMNWLLASAAIFQAARHFAVKQFQTVAILRCFGASFKWIMQRFFMETVLLSLLGGVVGFLLGFLVAYFSRPALEYHLQQPIEWNWISAISLSFLTIIILFLCFALPPLWALRKVTPLHIIRKTNSMPLQEPGALMSCIRKRYIRIIGRLGVGVRYGMSNCFRSPIQSGIQIIVFTLLMLCAWLVFLIRTDLLHTWRHQIPLHAPSFSIISTLAMVIEVFWVFIAIMAFMLLWCAIQINKTERQAHVALFRALGANSAKIFTMVLSEFCLLGFISGFIAALLANGFLAWLSLYVFELPYTFNGWVLSAGPGVGMALVGILGWLGLREIRFTPPRLLLSAH